MGFVNLKEKNNEFYDSYSEIHTNEFFVSLQDSLDLLEELKYKLVGEYVK